MGKHMDDLMAQPDMPDPFEWGEAIDMDIADARREAWDKAGTWERFWLWLDGRKP